MHSPPLLRFGSGVIISVYALSDLAHILSKKRKRKTDMFGQKRKLSGPRGAN